MGIKKRFPAVDVRLQCTLVLTEGRLVSRLFCTHYQYHCVSPNEADCLWLYLKDDIPTLDQFSSRVEQDERQG